MSFDTFHIIMAFIPILIIYVILSKHQRKVKKQTQELMKGHFLLCKHCGSSSVKYFLTLFRQDVIPDSYDVSRELIPGYTVYHFKVIVRCDKCNSETIEHAFNQRTDDVGGIGLQIRQGVPIEITKDQLAKIIFQGKDKSCCIFPLVIIFAIAFWVILILSYMGLV